MTNAGKLWCDAELGVPPSGRGDGEAAEAVQERSLEDFSLFAMYLDTVHRGGQAFVVALGVDLEGKKLPLGFWEGATENHEICEELLEGLERRGLKLSKRVLWVTDGGGGIIKALKDRYGKKLIHQRCTLHKDRNIQRHLPKRYRKQAHHLFATALEQNSYKDAKKMLQEFERWLRDINESAADSLVESLEEVLMLHKLKVHALLRKSCTRRILSRACSPWFSVASATSNATVAARCASDGSLPCFCTASNSQTSQGARIHRRGRCCHRCDPSRGRDA